MEPAKGETRISRIGTDGVSESVSIREIRVLNSHPFRSAAWRGIAKRLPPPYARGMTPTATAFSWLRTGDEAFAAMLAAIGGARQSVRLETYIFTVSQLGERFRAALVAACVRGVRVQVLVDAWGSMSLPEEFWEPFITAGGEFRWFNPLRLHRFSIRDHRKLLVCDETTAFIGGFNIAPEHEGDGITRGWRDHGLQVSGPLVGELRRAFDDSFERAEFHHGHFVRLRKSAATQTRATADGRLLLSGPGRGRQPLKSWLLADLKAARSVQIAAAYFVPTLRIRHALTRVARRSGRVQLLLAGPTDVPLSQLASRSLYQPLLRAGVEIYEYQPQVLHAKLTIIDDAVYVGSANLDARSLGINYELVVRLANPRLAAEARGLFAEDLAHARRIDAAGWRRSRTFWSKLKERWAHFLITQVDPRFARRQLRNLR